MENYLNLLLKIYDSSELDNLDLLFESLNKIFGTDGRVFVAGNGGSFVSVTCCNRPCKIKL